MQSEKINKLIVILKSGSGLLARALLIGMLFSMPAQALTLKVVDETGVAIDNYRWVLEEDATKDSVPGQLANETNLSLSFHTSYMPVVAKGNSLDPDGVEKGNANLATLDLSLDKRYYISVMPGRDNFNAQGQPAYQMGGAQIAKGQTEVTVKMIKGAIPTAQISVFVFEDNQPINGAPDLPQELGLGGFELILLEAGGTYGASGGQVTQNAFGDPIGTEYEFNPDGTPQMVDGAPVIKTMGKGFVVTSSKATAETPEKGVALIKYLVPGKYTILAVAPGGSNPKNPDVWHQTSTIEGTKGIDAWVKGNEPSFFAEFGPPGHHVFIGFVKDINDTSVLSGGSTIKGTVVNMHTARPPVYSFFPGEPIEKCRIGLSSGEVAVYTAPCDNEGGFTIPNVPAGTYELAIWDDPLDLVIALKTVTVPSGGAAEVDLGNVPVFNWFHRHSSRVFYDTDGDGFRDADEKPIPGQAINIRFRDGSIYNSSTTDEKGEAFFQEVFPFFNWMIAEVDFLRYKATGATVVVDNGGEIPAHDGWTTPSWGVLNPQPQSITVGAPSDGAPYRTETGPVLLEGFQGFLGTTNVIEWGKKNYEPGENGGIAGIVHYAITRAENDPRYAAAENWEPSVPRVQVNLYRDCNGDGIIDQPNCSSSDSNTLGNPDSNSPQFPQMADVDNYPFCWSDPDSIADATLCPTGEKMGAEDVERIGTDGVYSPGWTVDIAHTDSWDDSVPTECQGDVFTSTNGTVTDCYDGLRNFNQVRPAVFDGGYAFGGGAGKPELAVGTYIVEANTPPGYELVKEEDKNVDFGNSYTPKALLLPPECVGDMHQVPATLSLMSSVESPYALQDRPLCDRKMVRVAEGLNAAVDFFLFTDTPIAGHIVGMILDDTANEFDPFAPTFGERYAPSWVPISIRDWTGKEISRVYADQWGTYNALVPSTFSINPPMPSGVGPNMLTACMNHAGPIIDQRPGSSSYGKPILDPYFQRQYSQFCYTFQYLPGKTTYLDTPVVPVAAFAGPDQTALDCEFDYGTPVIYSVEGVTSTGATFGGPYVPFAAPYVPASFRITIGNNIANGDTITGIQIDGINILTTPASFTNVSGTNNTARNTRKTQLAQAIVAAVGNGYNAVFGSSGSATSSNYVAYVTITKTGVITGNSVMNYSKTGSVTLTGSAFASSGFEGTAQLKIISAGMTEVPNPAYTVGSANPKTIMRDYGFGPSATPGTVTLNNLNLPIVSWDDGIVVVNVPSNATTGQLMVTRGGTNGKTSVEGVTVTVGTQGSREPIRVQGGSIQAAIDAPTTLKGDLILVAPGTYTERVIIDKQVRVQGWGAPSTVINLAGTPTENMQAWRDQVNKRAAAGNFDLVQGQTTGFDPANNEPMLFTTEEGPAFLVAGKATGQRVFNEINNARIDGLTIAGADSGGGIFVNGYANYLEISNNRIIGNSGSYGGGIRFGHPVVTNDNFDATDLRGGYTDSSNDNVKVHHNHVTQNGAINEGSVAGGIGMSAGTDGYRINNNYICGNYSIGGGGGIGHVGHSANGMIDHNTVLFNESFDQGSSVHGGGILVAGQAPMGAGTSAGTGSVKIMDNLIQGNQAGAGDGGGVALMSVNGNDVAASNNLNNWYRVWLLNNKIVNNVAGLAGGGVVLQDVVRADISNNTIANNDSTATTGTAFAPGSPNESTPQSAGLVSRAHSAELLAACGNNTCRNNLGTFSNPRTLDHNILWHNRAFKWRIDRTATPVPTFGLEQGYDAGNPDSLYSDLAVLGTANQGTGPQFTNTGADKLKPTFSTLTRTTGYPATDNNNSGPPPFTGYVNTGNGETIIVVEGMTGVNATPAFDEGGNFIDVRYGPLSRNQLCDTEPCPANGVYVLPTASVTAPSFGSLPPTTPYVAPVVDPVVPDTTPDTTAVFVQCPGDTDGDAVPDNLVYKITVTGVQGITTGPTNARGARVDQIVIDGINILYTQTAQGSSSNSQNNRNNILAGNIISVINSNNSLNTLGYHATRPNNNSNVITINKSGAITSDSVMTYHVSKGAATLTGEAPPPSNVKCMHLSGGDGFMKTPDGRSLYTFGFSDLTGTLPADAIQKGTLAANYPGPTIKLREGQEFFLTLTNVGMAMRPDLFDPHTVHFHGRAQAAPVFDGMPDGSFGVNMGTSLTYYYNINDPGTYMYHCHQEATEHMQMGMAGNLYVMPKQDGTPITYSGNGKTYDKFVYNDGDGSTGYDVQIPLQLNSLDHVFHELHVAIQPLPFSEMKDTYAVINGRGYPDTVVPGALPAPIMEDGSDGVQSQLVSSLVTLDRSGGNRTLLLRISDLNVTNFYTLTALGLPMRVVGGGAAIARGPAGDDGTRKDMYYQTSSVTVGGGEAVEVIIDADPAKVPAGTYFLYTTNLNFLSNNDEDYGGMMTEIVITD